MGRPNKRKAASDSQFVGKKRIAWNKKKPMQWVLPENCNYLNPTRAHFIIKRIGLKNANIIRAYVAIIMEMTLTRIATKVTIMLILKKAVILIAKMTGTAKIV